MLFLILFLCKQILILENKEKKCKKLKTPVIFFINSKMEQRDISIEELNPLNMEIMNRQATINIGTIGHVAHGKTTLVKSISGVQVNRI